MMRIVRRRRSKKAKEGDKYLWCGRRRNGRSDHFELVVCLFFFSSRRRHTRCLSDWSSDVCSSDLGLIYVGDRNNRRIQVFDGDGNFKREIKIDLPPDPDAKPAIGNKPDLTTYLQTGGTMTPGAPWALCITPGPNQVLYSSDAFPGRIYKLSLDGKVLGYLGKSGKQLKQFGWIHEIACPSENERYVAEILNWRVPKLILRPGPEQQKAEIRN